MTNEIKGLNDEQVKQSRATYGRNTIPESKPTTFWEEFKGSFDDPMIKILLAIACLMFIMYFFGYAQIYEPIGIITAVLIVAVVTAKTGVASDTKYRALRASTKKSECKAYRNGQITVIDIEEVVVGDNILLQSGDKIPADGTLISGKLSVDNAALNGETEECAKTAAKEGEDSFKPGATVTGETITDSHSLFRGAIVVDGEGVLEVKKIGICTMMGALASEMQEDEPDSPLKVKLNKLAKQISVFGYVGAVVISLLYMLWFIIQTGGLDAYLGQGLVPILKDLAEAVSLAIVIIVCAVPEGLPLMISLVLMRNTSKMLDHNVLVRKAIGIETAGSLNILFSDKTGTITKGELEVTELYSGADEPVTLTELEGLGEFREQLHLAIGRNKASTFVDHKAVGGNATDRALLNFMGEDACERLDNNPDYKEVTIQSFNSANKFSQSYVHNIETTYYKGAPEKLLINAKGCLNKDGDVVPLDTERIEQRLNTMAKKSMRTLAFGYSAREMTPDTVNDDFILIGFVGIRDDVRPEARAAIEEVQKAGIQVIMITGDRLETAEAIGRDAGLLKADTDIVLTSAKLNTLTDDEIKEILPNIRVIARALPTDKSRMVRICQELNLVTGMTGDGVNDSPALKRADVGFAMGSGTEAAKEAGKIVILDDNFKSIKDAVWYGRTIYHNILKFCKFQLVINVAAVVVSALAPFFGISEPLKVTHLLFVNLVMDSLGAIMLGGEPALAQYMDEPPRRRDESIISKQMLIQIITMGAWATALSFWFLKSEFIASFFGSEEQKLTAYFVLFIAMALFNGFNVRDDSYGILRGLGENTNFIKVFLTILLIQACIVNAPLIPLTPFQWIGNMFSCVPFSVAGWALVLCLAALIIPVDLCRKLISNAVCNRN